jgi:hypothetical protein
MYGCTQHDGAVTVSSIIKREPLATAYAYCGALWLMSIMYLQSDSTTQKWRPLLAFAGGKLLAMPLVLPLESLHNSAVNNGMHDWFAFGGAVLEASICVLLMVEQSMVHTPENKRLAYWLCISGTVVLVLAVALGGVFAFVSVGPYSLLACEYVFGSSLVFNTVLIHYYSLG